MVTNNRLQIFTNFIVDRTLQKYQKNSSESDEDNVLNDSQGFANFNSDQFSLTSNPGLIDGVPRNFSKRSKFSIPILFKRNKSKEVKPSKEKIVLTVSQFFKSIFDSIEELKKVEGVIDHYHNVIKNAEITGQVALIEAVKEKLNLIALESILINNQFNKYLNEDQIVKFFSEVLKYEKTDKYLKLSWIKNYTRIIPNKIVEAKKEADLLKVFDNYVVLHFSPNKDSEKMTKKEKEKAADPILFGVIQDSNKLYYIGDWIDEHCDLTLDVLLEKINEKSFDINEQSVKTIIK